MKWALHSNIFIPDKMWVRYLGFVILFGLPGALHAQSATQPCGAPGFDGGFFFPKQETYSHEIEITYACDSGRKPAVKGWWATSTCQNGVWSPEPQCIGKCFNIFILCLLYKTLSKWPSFPVPSILACGEPPQIPHAVIVGQRYQEVFAADSSVKYECEDGYSVEGAESKKTIFCISGNWTEGPTCSKGTRPGSGGVRNCGTFPTVANGEVVESNESFLKYSCKVFYKLVGPETVLCYGNGTWSNIPICRDAYCAVNTDEHPLLVSVGKVFIKEGEEKEFDCVHQDEWWFNSYSVGKCTTEGLRFLQCCVWCTKIHIHCCASL
uniref:Sushi domain-containing protein n=1 Tax=Labrus bergylta TaxID=56723 RepID=A0A3Q3ESC6_9LABR